jgi:2-keto-4-pentenoate hydratase/2-oxohepta-3-ene-1,7-dioic acid hydratase in catechol pathway
MQVLERWDAFRSWAEGVAADAGDAPLDPARLGPCVPRPRKVFGIGLNYRDHAAEAGLEIPSQPLVFAKFPSCLAGPTAEIPLSSNRVDWEVELVVAVARRAKRLSARDALGCVAGYCVGQDVSDRRQQFADRPPQFTLGKSFDGFGPIGPALVTVDAFADPDDLALRCDVSGERVQDGRTRDMIFPVAELLEFLSRYVTLESGDLVFTGTPAGVGSARKPPRYLVAGDVVESEIEGIGRLRNTCREP